MHHTHVARNGSLRTSNNSPSDTVDSARAAISGASFAFKAHPSLISTKELSSQPNSAIAAAALAGRRPKRPPTPPKKPALPLIRHQTADNAHASNIRVRDMVKELDSTPPTRVVALSPRSTGRPSIHSRSPSQIAASLAAGKAVQAKVPLEQMKNGTRNRNSIYGIQDESPALISGPIERSTSRSRTMRGSPQTTESIRASSREQVRIVETGTAQGLHNNAQPLNSPALPRRGDPDERRGSTKNDGLDEHQPERRSRLSKAPVRQTEILTQEAAKVNPRIPNDEEIARPRQTKAKAPGQPRERIGVSSPGPVQPTFELLVAETPIRSGRLRSGSAVSGVSTSPAHSTHSLALQPSPRRHDSSSLAPLRDQLTGMTESSLADAIVASSLASSRAPSPSKKPQPPPPRRTHSRPSLFSLSSDEPVEKSTSPARGMRRTLRETPKMTAEPTEQHRKHRLMKKHPHKHHEGDRKRWRDQLTEQERKRYEGVWAANKGLNMLLERPVNELTASTASLSTQRGRNQDMVLNLVVREIWSRSKLPIHLLEQIWKLVDLTSCDRLSREEFVVGMWLIDQCLKGRKLPLAVTQSVWASVRHISGIQVLPSK